MRCPKCGFENPDASVFCEQCGSMQHMTQDRVKQNEYTAPPPPPLNGHRTILPSRSSPQSSSPKVQPQLLVDQEHRARTKVGIFSSLLYFIGLIIATFGVMGTIVTLGTGTFMSSLAFLSGIILLVGGIIFFIRIRRRFTLLRWWQRMLWIGGATVGVFIVLAIGNSLFAHTNALNTFTSCMLLLYGLIWMAIAVW